MKIIDLKLANGFRRMKAALKTDAEMARVLGISRAHIGRILKGSTYFLEDETWARIEPLIKKYVHDDDPSNVEPPAVIRNQRFPVISEAAAASCNTAYFPIADWAEEYAEDRVSFSEGRPGDFVIRVSGESMMPWYPPNTLILARPHERLKSGDRVIAVLGDGSVVFKVFAEKGDKFFLFSVNSEDGRDFTFRKDDFTSVRGMYLVIQSMRDERALDNAMSKNGIAHFWQKKLEEMK